MPSGPWPARSPKPKALTVIGSAGGAQKTAYLKHIGVDEAIDYKADAPLAAALKAAAPGGIDIYFDNVGGDHLEAAIQVGRPCARIILCGAIAASPSGPRNLVHMIAKQMRMDGVTVFAHMDKMPVFQRELRRWVTEGKVTWRETVLQGIERAPEALMGLFTGAGIGKTLVKLV